ncbi:unnamed protein product, partial [Arabidopsis halleri]
MQNRWFSNGRASALNPRLPTAGGNQFPSPPLPPDPPDPPSDCSLSHFPPLSPALSKVSKLPSQTALVQEPAVVKVTPPHLAEVSTSLTTDVEMHPVENTISPIPDPVAEIPRSGSTVTEQGAVTEKFTVLSPKSTSPLLTNKASATLPLNQTPNTPSTSSPSINLTTSKETVVHAPSIIFEAQAQSPVQRLPAPHAEASTGRPAPASRQRTMADRLKKSVDRSLKRLAPASLSASGRPTIHIPDEVFQKGAEIHNDFIICYFNGRPPLYHQIQSVLNHMWGKGRRLEIHKVLEKCIWYIGDSMFHTAPWGSHLSSESPTFDSLPIWIHLLNIPLDLHTDVGISLIAGLVGEPKEMDDFTINLVSLKVAH